MPSGIIERRDGAVLELVLDRPDKLNAISPQMYDALAEGFERAFNSRDIAVVLLSGSDGQFSAGNDLRDLLDPQSNDRPAHWLIESVVKFDKPIVAAVEGLAIGIGTTILLHCDIVVASSAARFRLPFVRLGLVPEFASTLLIPRLVGLQKASDLVLTGREFDAAEAERIGLVSRLVPAGRVLPEARALAQELASLPEQSVLMARRLLRAEPAELLARHQQEARLFRERLAAPETRDAIARVLEPKP